MTESLLFWVNEERTLIDTPQSVRDNSFFQLPETAKLRQQNKIFSFLLTQNASNTDLEEALGIRMSSVTARINELRTKGLITVAGSKINPKTGKLNIVWSVT